MNDTMKELRHKAKMTQRQAADYLKVSLRTYKEYENNPAKATSLKYEYMQEKLSELCLVDENHGILSVDEIKRTCESVFSNYAVNYCYLFGSYARSSQKSDSDVDLLVSTNLHGIRFYGMVDSIRAALKKNVDVLSLGQLKDNPELIDNVLKDGIKIYG